VTSTTPQTPPFSLGVTEDAHQIGFAFVAAIHQAGDEATERFLRRRPQKARHSCRVLRNQTPEVRRVIGDAERQIAQRRALKEFDQIRRVGLLEQAG
jgi:hypothetical protein